MSDLIDALLPRGTRRRHGAKWIQTRVREIVRQVKPDSSTHIFVACFQKSGSTYLTKLLSQITGFPSRAMVAAYGHSEQDVFDYALQEWVSRNSVTHQHAKGTYENVMLLKNFNIRPVVLVRNIFDVIVSLFDHIEDRPRVPTGYVHTEYASMTRDEKLSYLIKVHLPWYFNFFVSWREASNELDVLWTTYDELFADQVKTVARILEFYGIRGEPNTITNGINAVASDKQAIRFNVGISGRGQQLSDQHKQAIYEIADVWRIEDMQVIGIG